MTQEKKTAQEIREKALRERQKTSEVIFQNLNRKYQPSRFEPLEKRSSATKKHTELFT